MQAFKKTHVTTFSALQGKKVLAAFTRNKATPGIQVSDDKPRNEPLPFSSVPSDRCLPLVGTLRPSALKLTEGRFHELMIARFRQFGPIYKEKIGPRTLVMTCDASAVEAVHRQEGKFPKRFGMDHWQDWRDANGEESGVLTIQTDGEKWKRMRSALDKQLMRPINVAGYSENFNEVSEDFVSRIRATRDSGGKVATIDNELFNWSLESICTVLYEIRLGGLSERRDPELQKFIEAVNAMFKNSEMLTNIPLPLLKYFGIGKALRKKHDDSWSTIFNVTKKLMNDKLVEIQQTLDRGEEASGFIAGVIAKQKLTLPELYGNISELMAAAVDTTSNTMQFALDLLAHNPEIQEKLYHEVVQVLGDNDATYSDLQKLPFLRGFVREVQRLYPVAVGATRILDEEIILCNYRIPPQTMILTAQFATGKNPDYFPEPEKVRPERWFRDSQEKKTINPFTALPFGYGQRSCIGRRIAEMEMYALLIKVSLNFKLQSESGKRVPIRTRMVFVPQYPVDVQFIDRH